MLHRLMSILAFVFIVSILATIGFAQTDTTTSVSGDDDAMKKQIELKVIENRDNLKKPKFEWGALPGVRVYQLYFNDELVYSGEVNNYVPPRDMAYGYYLGYVLTMLKDGKKIKGEPIEFVIGIKKPDLLNLKEGQKTYYLKPKFIWSMPTGSEEEELYIDQDKFVDRKMEKAAEYKHTKNIAPFGKHAWGIVAKNQFQRVRSDRGEFILLQLGPVDHKTPENGYSKVVLAESDIPTMSWSDPMLDGKKCEVIASEPFSYELYLNGKKIYSGNRREFRTTDLEPGRYEWYVKVKCADQEVQSDPTSFELKEPLGLNVGVKAGGNLMNTSNDYSNIGIRPNAGAWADLKLWKKNKFTLKTEMDLLFDAKTVAFESADNSDYIVDNLHITNYSLSIPLMIKPEYKIKGFGIYGLAGPEVDFIFLSNIIRDDGSAEEALKAQTPKFNFQLVLGAGVGYTFDINFLFGKKLYICGEFRYYRGFMNTLEDSFLGPSSKMNTFMVLVGTRIIDF